MAVRRINLIGVPVDILRQEDLEMTVLELLAKPGAKYIVFLTVWDLLRARHKGEFQEFIKSADLIIPVSKSILIGAKFLKKEVPVRYNPFTQTISILSVLDSHFKSLYLLGSRGQTLHVAERNLRATFPHLKIVGRHVGYYPKNKEDDIVLNIYKTAPSMVIVSEGIKENALWAYKRRNKFSSSIFCYYKDSLGIFSKRIKRVDEEVFNKGHEIWHEIVKNPLKIFLLLPYIKYIMILVFYRLFRR
ncbi:MAG: WecB/TagA/CpsF family glycosyltransferase [Treponema sp.]|nr:WecB/TagA/CpsF family glycosyltransferase [Treponema sp.]